MVRRPKAACTSLVNDLVFPEHKSPLLPCGSQVIKRCQNHLPLTCDYGGSAAERITTNHSSSSPVPRPNSSSPRTFLCLVDWAENLQSLISCHAFPGGKNLTSNCCQVTYRISPQKDLGRLSPEERETIKGCLFDKDTRTLQQHLVTVGHVELEAGLGEQLALPGHCSPEGKPERDRLSLPLELSKACRANTVHILQ